MLKKGGSFSLWWTVFLWFSVKSLETKVWILSSYKIKWCLFCDSVYISYYIVSRSSDFSVMGIDNVYL